MHENGDPCLQLNTYWKKHSKNFGSFATRARKLLLMEYEDLRAKPLRFHLVNLSRMDLPKAATSLTPRKLCKQQQLTFTSREITFNNCYQKSEPAKSAARCQYNSRPNLSREQIHLSPLDAFFRRHTVHSSSKRRT
jgi:hypothetical protein